MSVCCALAWENEPNAWIQGWIKIWTCPWPRPALYRGFWPKPWTSVLTGSHHPYFYPYLKKRVYTTIQSPVKYRIQSANKLAKPYWDGWPVGSSRRFQQLPVLISSEFGIHHGLESCVYCTLLLTPIIKTWLKCLDDACRDDNKHHHNEKIQ